jgi:hypothetical protein
LIGRIAIKSTLERGLTGKLVSATVCACVKDQSSYARDTFPITTTVDARTITFSIGTARLATVRADVTGCVEDSSEIDVIESMSE